MNTFKSLKILVNRLEPEEIGSLFKHLKAYRGEASGEDLKCIRLVKLLLRRKESNVEEAMRVVYGDGSRKTFDKLLSRTKDKILEEILLDVNLARDIYSERNRAVFEIKKKLIQCQILYSRGITGEFEKLLGKVITKSIEYEVYDSLIEALKTKQRYAGFRFGSKEFIRIEEDIIYYEDCRRAVLKSRSIFIKIGTLIEDSLIAEDYTSDLIKGLKEMKIDLQKNYSPTVELFYLFLEVEKFQNHSINIARAQSTLKKLNELLIAKPCIYTNLRHGDVLMNLAQNSIYLRDFNLAASYIEETRRIYLDIPTLQVSAFQIEFMIHYYSMNHDHALKIIEKLYSMGVQINRAVQYSTLVYLYAALMTVRNNFTKSINLMIESGEISNLANKWIFGKKVLNIINYCEIGNLDKAESLIKSYSRFIKKITTTKKIRRRDIVISQILQNLSNFDFDYERTFKNNKKQFELLDSSKHEYEWKINSPELIVFHKWFLAKIKGEQYRFSLEKK